MFRYICFILIFIFCFPLPCHSSPSVSAQAAIVIESSTGNVIYNKNARRRLPMASTTKIMTSICAIENTKPDTLITVNDAAVGIEGSSVYLARNEKITIKDLIYAMMLNSGNDAATALAYEISGSVESFAELMNKTAQSIGAKDTHFTNPSGLYEEDHYTTAHDLAMISAYALKNPLFAEIVSTREKTITNGEKDYPRKLRNHNRLLSSYDGCIGVKTGYTKKCGRCLVSCAKRDGVMLICVTLNAPNDWQDHTSLLDYGFSQCKSVVIANQDDYCRTISVGKHNPQKVKVKFKDAFSFVSQNGKTNDVSVSYYFKENLTLPITEGESVGKASLYVDGVLCCQSEIVCAQRVIYVEERDFYKTFFTNLKSFLNFE